MARQRFYYRPDKEGKIRRIESNQVAKHVAGEAMDDFDTRMRKTLYQLECEKGSRFHIPEFTKSQLKAVWFDNKAA